MRKTISLLAGAILTAAVPAAAAPALSPEAKLARALEGRVAGEPVDCINLRSVSSSQVIRGTAILYNAGGTIYVNRPRTGAESLNGYDALVTRTHSSRLCSVDVVETRDLRAGMMTGLVFLGEFVPYKRVDSARR